MVKVTTKPNGPYTKAEPYFFIITKQNIDFSHTTLLTQGGVDNCSFKERISPDCLTYGYLLQHAARRRLLTPVHLKREAHQIVRLMDIYYSTLLAGDCSLMLI